MPFIQPQTASLTFQGGINSKTDALQLQPPSLLSLQNARFDKVGALNKRPGYNILGNQVVNNQNITSSVAIDTFLDELNLFDNQNIYTYLKSIDSWQNRGPAISVVDSNLSILRSSTSQQLNPDSTSVSGITLFVWEDSRGTCRYSTLDNATGAFASYDLPISDAQSKPKCIVFNNIIYLFYISGSVLYYRTLNPTNPGPATLSAPISILSDGMILLGVTWTYDICVSNNFIWIIYFRSTGGGGPTPVNLVFRSMDINNNISGNTQIDTGANVIDIGAGVTTTVCSIYGDSLNHLWFAWSNGTSLRVAEYNPSIPSFLLTSSVVDSLGSNYISQIELANTPGNIQIIYQLPATNPTNTSTKIVNVSVIGAAVVINILGSILSVGLASKAFFYNNNNYINLAYQSPLQSTYFTALITSNPFTIVGKISSQVGGGLRTNNELPEVCQVTTGQFLWANLVKGQFISEDNTSFSLLGVNRTISNFNDQNKFNNVTFSDNLLFVGGVLQSYDGSSVVEQNFHVFPEGISNSIQAAAGSLSAGQYQYQVVYAWTDRFGQIQYSTPSVALTVTNSVNDANLLTIPTLRLTAKTNVVIKVYRTQVNSIVPQEVTSELAPLLNDTTINSVTFLDSAADASIVANQVIYSTGAAGGILPNSAPPSCSLISLYNNRVVLGGLEDPNLLWFSKNKVNNTNFNTIPVEFSALNTIGVNQEGGGITALGLMNGNLIIFKESIILAMTGDGVNDTGGGTPFNDPQIITKSVGCTNQNSVILTNAGIMFQTPDKGIWMLPLDLGSPIYVGSGVDDESKQFTISSASLDHNSNSIIFTTSTGPALVYDYLISQWVIWTNHQSSDGVIFGGQFTYSKANGYVYQQNQNIFYDGYVGGIAQPYSLELTTPWLSYAHNLGYQSIFRFFILGQYRGTHSLAVDVGYNYNPEFSSSAVIDATGTAGANVWGAGSTWGSPSPWGGSWNPYIYQVNTSIQKCASFRIRIQDAQTSQYNEGYTISNILVELGLLGKGIRTPLTNKVAAK